MGELGPVSQAILDYIHRRDGYISVYSMVLQVSRKTGACHSGAWWFRRLAALCLEGCIEGKVYRTGDDVAIRFRRLREAED